ncbi:hypothetical protein LTS18_009586, partial [Coniosporium uncinatum]
LPKAYSLNVGRRQITNTYVFSEKDLPGYKPNAFGRNQNSRPGDRYKVQKGKNRVRKSIPKHTALLGYARDEASLNPLDLGQAKHAERMLLEKYKSERDPKVYFNTKWNPQDAFRARREQEANWSEFVPQPGQKPKKSQENKFVKMDNEGQLLEMLLQCFTEFEYWSFKSLKARLRVPDQQLKEVLDRIAVLIQAGPFNNTYRLTESYKRTIVSFQPGKGEAAPEVKDEDMKDEEDDFDDGDDVDDDDDPDMEDVPV